MSGILESTSHQSNVWKLCVNSCQVEVASSVSAKLMSHILELSDDGITHLFPIMKQKQYKDISNVHSNIH